MGNGLLQSVADNVVFVLVCVGVAVGLFAIAYAAEKYVYKRDGITSVVTLVIYKPLSPILKNAHMLSGRYPFSPVSAL